MPSATVEPTKVCAMCGKRKPWGQYHAKKRWPDGSIRQPHSYCNPCRYEYTRQYRRAANQRYWAKYAGDPARYSEHLARRRELYRIQRAPRPRELVASGPIAAWITGAADDAGGLKQLARRLGMDESNLRRICRGTSVDITTVDSILVAADDPGALNELYPING